MNTIRNTQYAIRTAKINAVLFDLGETLLNFGKVDVAAFFLAASKSSYNFLKSKGQPVGSFYYYRWRNLTAIRLCYIISKITGKDFDSLELLKKVNKKVKLSTEQWEHLAWLWYEPLGNSAKVEAGTFETLKALKEKGLKLGIVSNTFIPRCVLEKHLQQLNILDFFALRLFSYQFDFRKPDLRIFKKAAEKIAEQPENILFVGDRVDVDIKPALKIGMVAVLKDAYTNNKTKSPNGAWKINHLSELPALIERIGAEYIEAQR